MASCGVPSFVPTCRRHERTDSARPATGIGAFSSRNFTTTESSLPRREPAECRKAEHRIVATIELQSGAVAVSLARSRSAMSHQCLMTSRLVIRCRFLGAGRSIPHGMRINGGIERRTPVLWGDSSGACRQRHGSIVTGHS
jgi:hypothetical protein